jgi:hypothetical protein
VHSSLPIYYALARYRLQYGREPGARPQPAVTHRGTAVPTGRGPTYPGTFYAMLVYYAGVFYTSILRDTHVTQIELRVYYAARSGTPEIISEVYSGCHHPPCLARYT